MSLPTSEEILKFKGDQIPTSITQFTRAKQHTGFKASQVHQVADQGHSFLLLRRPGATSKSTKLKTAGGEETEADACLAYARRAPVNLGHPSQAVCCRGRGEATRGAARQSSSVGAGAPRLRGDRGVQRRGLTSWSSLALIAPVAGPLLRDRRS